MNMCSHRFIRFGTWVENCILCNTPNPEIVAFVKDTAFALENDKPIPEHPYLANGRISTREFKKLNTNKRKRFS